MRCCTKWGGCSHRAGPPAPSSPPRPSRRSSRPPAEVISTVPLTHRYYDILVRTHHEQLVAPSGSPLVDVGVDAEPIPAPGEQQKSAQGGEECASEHAAL